MSVKGSVQSNKTSIDSDEIIANETGDGIQYVGMDHDAWMDIKGELNPKYITICVPGNVVTLYHCDNESVVSIDQCTDVTEYIIGDPTYNSALGCTEFVVPGDLGFSVYFGVTSDGSPGGSSSGGGGGGSSNLCFSDWVCTEWGECQNGMKKRTCTDLEGCDPPTSDRPDLVEYCGGSAGQPGITGFAAKDIAITEPEDKPETESKGAVDLIGQAFKSKHTIGVLQSAVAALVLVFMVLLAVTFAAIKSKKRE